VDAEGDELLAEPEDLDPAGLDLPERRFGPVDQHPFRP